MVTKSSASSSSGTSTGRRERCCASAAAPTSWLTAAPSRRSPLCRPRHPGPRTGIAGSSRALGLKALVPSNLMTPRRESDDACYLSLRPLTRIVGGASAPGEPLQTGGASPIPPRARSAGRRCCMMSPNGRAAGRKADPMPATAVEVLHVARLLGQRGGQTQWMNTSSATGIGPVQPKICSVPWSSLRWSEVSAPPMTK